MNRKAYCVLNLVLGCISVLLPTLALAQAQLEEIVVTAQKREESQQDVPIAIEAFKAETLEKAGIDTAETLALVTPGLTYYRASSSASPFIRGLGGITTAVGSEASVATYVDGVYIRDMATLAMPYNNVERVEVLKGPQGTLFGRNATGGLIQTITKTPGEPEANLRIEAGRFGVLKGDFYGSARLGEMAAADLAVTTRSQADGVGVNRTLNRKSGYEDFTSVRSKWRFDVSSATDITVTGQWGTTKTDIGFNKACDPRYICLAPVSPNFADTFAQNYPHKEATAWLGALHIGHRFENVELRSITAYQESDADLFNDVDGAAVVGTDFNLFQNSETLSQELQLASTAESRLQWIVGAFYWDDKAYLDPTSNVVTAMGPSFFRSTVKTKSYAGYGQAYYSFTDATRLTVGVRYTKDEKELTATTPAGSFFIPVDFSRTTYRLALDHHFSDDLMGYASFNTGFRAGGFNGTVTGRPDAPIRPETVDAYALGLKADLLGNRFRINAEAYFNDIKDTHYRAYLPTGTALAYLNAAAGEVRGIELTATAAFSDRMTVQLGYSLVDSEYTSFPGCPQYTNGRTANAGGPGNLITRGDCAGKEMINTPKTTLSLSADYSAPLPVGRLDSSLTYYYNSGYWVGADHTYDQPSYNVLNASFTWISANDRYSIGLYGNNLTDEEYGNGRDQNNFGNLVPVGNFPREYGVRVGVQLTK